MAKDIDLLNQYFEKLVISRTNIAVALENPAVSKLKKLLTGMYSESAHFIYELLQNADDAGATTVNFLLDKEGLIFSHNGKTRFTITNPDTEEEDSLKGRLGHINSITSIGNSSKDTIDDEPINDTDEGNKIGKFGLGFKSVFQYTNTPEIYDHYFNFRIERLIVPVRLDKIKFPKKEKDTLFYFPFNVENKKINPTVAFEDIRTKLKSLDNPLLFLNTLRSIKWEIKGYEKGAYSKSEKYNRKENSIYISKLRSSRNGSADTFLVFSKAILNPEDNRSYSYSVAYKIDKDDHVIHSDSYKAFCFFPTQEDTRLKFLIHAPFLLTDNRQNIKKNEEWNKTLIEKLAELAADSIPLCKRLIAFDDDFFNVLPLQRELFYSQYYSSSGSYPNSMFYPFYNKVSDKLKSCRIIPVKNGKFFTDASHAFLGRGDDLIKLLDSTTASNKILSDLVNIENSNWVFSTFSENRNKMLWDYFRNELKLKEIEGRDFARMLTKSFLEQQTDSWMIKFYTYLLDVNNLWNESGILRKKEIIRTENGEHVPPFIEGNEPNVFLPGELGTEYPTVKKCFLDDNNSLAFLIRLGIKEADQSTEIFHKILPHYDEPGSRNIKALICDFEKFLIYARSCSSTKKAELINRLKNLAFCLAIQIDDENIYRIEPSRMYFPTEELLSYFEGNKDVYFLASDMYDEMEAKYGIAIINEFFTELGISSTPKIKPLENEHDAWKVKEIIGNWINYSSIISFNDFFLEGLDYVIANITKDKSLLLWNLFSNNYNIWSQNQGLLKYKYFTIKSIHYPPSFVRLITNSKWLYDNQDNLCSPTEIQFEDLYSEYDKNISHSFLKELNFKKDPEVIKYKAAGLSDDEISTIPIVKEFLKSGLTEKDLLNLIANATQVHPPTEVKNTNEVHNATSSIARQIESQVLEGARNKSHSEDMTNNTKGISDDQGNITEEDDFTPKTVDIENLKEEIRKNAEEKLASAIMLAEYENEALNAEPFTMKWFETLLELEYNSTKVDNKRKNSVCVTFRNAAIDDKSEDIIILGDAGYIPNWIEDNGELELRLNYKDKSTRTLLVDAVSRQKKTLKAKIKNADVTTLFLENVENATIEVKNADFILENLKNAFKRFKDAPFEYEADYNFRDNLFNDLKFIFGPPGTGKTTYLARNEIVSFMKKDSGKVLVLTPTNKAADVLTQAIMKHYLGEGDSSFFNWLVRYGITTSSDVEDTVFVGTRILPAAVLNKVTLVTTAARFPYDSIKIENRHGDDWKFDIKNFKWDYIVFDEASMIHIANIIYVLYYAHHINPDCKFIIGGDPYQIPPVTRVTHTHWEDGNIYTLVGLDKEDSFASPLTYPHDYEVVCLKKQFRSVPLLGEVYSRFSYSGILEHNRKNRDARAITIDNMDIKPITIIEFPVNSFESIYKPRTIHESPYQIYSAILAVEMIKYFVKNLKLPDSYPYRIGVICPYQIQSKIIDKMLMTAPPVKNIEIITGTVHGFQGDECDMIINVLNPPLYISSNPKLFLNRKNIINVSISRARDYLILLLPVNNAEKNNTQNLFLIEEIKRIIKDDKELCAGHIKLSNDYIEKKILGKEKTIENISFPTSHQNVNVYALSSHAYEIRYDENAVDIQIR